jgi:HNH endonuclease
MVEVPAKLKICAYCGKRPGVTSEHIIPKCLFGGNLPLDNVTIPVCKECNGEKAKDDGYLRDILVTDHQCSEHPVAQSLLEGKVARAAKRNQSQLAKAARKSGRFEPIYTSAGLYLGHGYAVPLEGERVVRVFSLIVRGLYRKLRHERLSDDYLFDVRKRDPLRVEELVTYMQSKGANGPYCLGSVFGCLFMYAQEDPNVTFWLLWFYNSMFVTVGTTRSSKPRGLEAS